MKLTIYNFIKRIIHNYIYILIIMSILAIMLLNGVGEDTGGQMLFINDLLKIPVVEVETNQLVEEINQLVEIENQKQPNNSRHVYIAIIGCIIGALIWLKG